MMRSTSRHPHTPDRNLGGPAGAEDRGGEEPPATDTPREAWQDETRSSEERLRSYGRWLSTPGEQWDDLTPMEWTLAAARACVAAHVRRLPWIVPPDPDDIALRLVTQLGLARESVREPKHWLRTAIMRQVWKAVREHKDNPEILTDDVNETLRRSPPLPLSDLPDDTDDPERDELIARLVNELRDKDRRIVCAVAFDRRPYAEIARPAGITANAVAQAFRRALARLAAIAVRRRVRLNPPPQLSPRLT